MTELFKQSGESDGRTARIWQVVICLVAFEIGFVGSYSAMSRSGVHSGFGGLVFAAFATAFGGVGGVLGLVIGGEPGKGIVGSTISSASLCLVLGAWIAVVVGILRYV